MSKPQDQIESLVKRMRAASFTQAPTSVATKVYGLDRGRNTTVFEITFEFRGTLLALSAWIAERVKELHTEGYVVKGPSTEGIITKLWPPTAPDLGESRRHSRYWHGFVTFMTQTVEQLAAAEREVDRSAREMVDFVRERHKPKPDAEGEIITD